MVVITEHTMITVSGLDIHSRARPQIVMMTGSTISRNKPMERRVSGMYFNIVLSFITLQIYEMFFTIPTILENIFRKRMHSKHKCPNVTSNSVKYLCHFLPPLILSRIHLAPSIICG